MSRIRSIKPEFFKSDDVSQLPLRTRLTWIGLWTQCDDHGRTKDDVRLIKADVWPLDEVSLKDVTADLNTLADRGRIVRYQIDGGSFLAVVNWHGHQSINRPSRSRYPAPPVPIGAPAPGENGHCESCWLAELNAHGRLSEGSLQEGKGKEGKGGDARASPEPPRQCPQHVDNPKPPPCGKCADARRTHERWTAQRGERVRDAPKCRKHRGQLAENCARCRSEELGGTT